MLKTIILLALMCNCVFSQWTRTMWPMDEVSDIFFFDTSRGIIYGNTTLNTYLEQYSQIGRSNDGGQTWNVSQFPYFGNKLHALSEQILFAYNREIYRSIDGGSNWEIVFSTDDAIGRIQDVEFIDDRNGYFISDERVYRTNNSGKDWTRLTAPLFDVGYYGIIHFIDDSTGWIAPEYGESYEPFIWTYDGGKSWIERENPMPLQFFKPKSFVTPLLGFVTAGYRDVYVTKDGGLTWDILNNSFPTKGFINDLEFISERIGFIGGEYYNDDETFSQPCVYRTKDGGQSWVQIFKWGEHWKKIVGMHFLNENHGWVCVDSRLFRTNNGGITDIIMEDIAQTNLDFELVQNYPNPFNPSTKIKYSIPKKGFVVLKVFDVLGSEVATLVNLEQPIGNYEVEFNAIKLPSGIYFYKLQAGKYTETKKMVLLR